MPNPTPDVDEQMQGVFLDAKNKADAEGYGGVAYCFGIQAVMELLAERERDREMQQEWAAMTATERDEEPF